MVALAIVHGWGLALMSFGPSPATSPVMEDEPSQPEVSPSAAPATAACPADRPAPPQERFFVAPRAWGTALEAEPPDYARRLDETGIPGLESMDWLEFGLEHRTRFELRDDDYRRDALVRDEQFLLRSRGYVGIRRILDPLRLGLEFQDSRQFASRFPERPTDVNEADFVQAFAELYFDDAVAERPLRLAAGRFTLDVADRRLVNRNRWQNAMNTFDGFRLRLGEPRDDWQMEAFSTQVVDVRLREFDRPDEERRFHGLTAAWRRWSRIITLQPYWFLLEEDRRDRAGADRAIHTVGLHGYGLAGDSGLDYDFSVMAQYGEDGPRRHRALASYGELGYTFAHPWKPRVAAAVVCASGDGDPDDSLSERFDRLFVTARHWSTLSLFTIENVIGPKLRASVRPARWLSCDAGCGVYWLARDEDGWPMAGRRDPAGRSGSFVGQELDVRLVFRLNPRVDVETGYACFLPGRFARETGPADDSDFLYVQTTVRLFE